MSSPTSRTRRVPLATAAALVSLLAGAALLPGAGALGFLPTFVGSGAFVWDNGGPIGCSAPHVQVVVDLATRSADLKALVAGCPLDKTAYTDTLVAGSCRGGSDTAIACTWTDQPPDEVPEDAETLWGKKTLNLTMSTLNARLQYTARLPNGDTITVDAIGYRV